MPPLIKLKTVVKLSLLMPAVSLTALCSYRFVGDAGAKIGGDAALRIGAAGDAATALGPGNMKTDG